MIFKFIVMEGGKWKVAHVIALQLEVLDLIFFCSVAWALASNPQIKVNEESITWLHEYKCSKASQIKWENSIMIMGQLCTFNQRTHMHKMYESIHTLFVMNLIKISFRSGSQCIYPHPMKYLSNFSE